MALIASRHVAARLGIKTGTLAKWRSKNLGPQRWIYLSPTLVVYPEEEVDRFLDVRSQVDKPSLQGRRR
jgi:predicted DNA-binding transcriptional regulator AlpA